METGIPFNAAAFVKALQMIYKKTHPPDGDKEVVPKGRKEQ